MKTLTLHYGANAIVDDDTYIWANRWKWSNDRNYAVRRKYISYKMVDGKKKQKYGKVYLHREVIKAKPGQTVDHINGNKLDNRRSNLRICSMQENAYNRRTQSNCKSGIKGVYWHKRGHKWCVEIRANKKKYYLGLYESKSEAKSVYQEAAKRLHGEFARLNQ